MGKRRGLWRCAPFFPGGFFPERQLLVVCGFRRAVVLVQSTLDAVNGPQRGFECWCFLGARVANNGSVQVRLLAPSPLQLDLPGVSDRGASEDQQRDRQ